MRKYIKNQLLEILSAMSEANSLSESLFREKKQDEALDMLGEQQQAAVHIGEAIEQLEGEAHPAIAELEEHCELIWKCSQEERRSERLECYKQLGKNLNQLRSSIDQGISVQYEILFLPYMASMWDSMESVWLAAKEDKTCECFVMPIPYYDKAEDGTFLDMHYEGGLFPDYVPITDYRVYDQEARRPDAIFIHNPYDQHNHVTSIHPNYYSKRLKECTDLLVYIPYFVALGEVAEDFCICTGTLYADRVIVQSEEVKTDYINKIRNYEKENDCVGSFGNLKRKIQALGSPKLDKVLRTSREEVDLPAKWAALIQNMDGTNKKVVLYNTSIVSLLEHGEKEIIKIHDVFRIFRERPGLVLLWRPHPLSISTCASLRPMLLDAYRLTVDTYLREGWGIYDDSADVNRAIAVSDAYYGDWSSLVELYKATGKPILIQNVDVTQESELC